MRIESETTIKFLQQIAKHLSGRKDCRKVEYEVQIYEDSSNKLFVVMHPFIDVYPNVHEKHQWSKTSVVSHVLNEHFDDTIQLVPGTYIYKLSAKENRRKWIRKSL